MMRTPIALFLGMTFSFAQLGHAAEMPTTLDQVWDLYQAAKGSGSSAEVAQLTQSVDTLFAVPVAQLRNDIGLTPGFGEDKLKYAPLNSATASSVPALAVDLTKQGIAMLHNFHYIDAVRSLEQATRVAPEFADAKIFLSMSYILFSGDIGGYLFATKELADLKQMSLTPTQEAWRNFAENYVFQSPSSPLTRTAYQQLLSATGREHEAVTLAGWLSNLGTAKDYENVLTQNPDHVGANHYLVHLHEFSSKFDLAETYAIKLAQLSLKGAHAQHMYGHVLPMVGDLTKAIEQFEIADQLHKDWATRNGFDPDFDWHFSHNNHLMGVAYLANGQTNEAYGALKAGCRVDFRSCDGWAKAAVLSFDEAAVEEAKKLASAQDPASAAQVAAYFNRYLSEIRYVSGVESDAAVLQQLAAQYQDNVLQVIALLKGMTAASPTYRQIIRLVDSFFMGGGFDSWTNGYPNAMRVRAAAVKFGPPELVTYIDNKVNSILHPVP